MAQTIDIDAIRKLSTAERVALAAAVLRSLLQDGVLPEPSRASVEAMSRTIEELKDTPEEDKFDESAPDVLDIVKEVWGDLPEEAWEQLPKDGAKNLDHYLYGTPKDTE